MLLEIHWSNTIFQFCLVLSKGNTMNLIYNSEQYSVVEFGADDDNEALRYGGYEITDKAVKREFFMGGMQAVTFRKDVSDLIASDPSLEEVDDFLGQFDPYMMQMVTIH